MFLLLCDFNVQQAQPAWCFLYVYPLPLCSCDLFLVFSLIATPDFGSPIKRYISWTSCLVQRQTREDLLEPFSTNLLGALRRLHLLPRPLLCPVSPSHPHSDFFFFFSIPVSNINTCYRIESHPQCTTSRHLKSRHTYTRRLSALIECIAAHLFT